MANAQHNLPTVVDHQDRRLSWLKHLAYTFTPVKRFFARDSFMKLHYTYFLVTCLITSLIFWASSTPTRSVRYIDAVFLTVSAMTEAGLNTVNLSTLNTFQQFILFLLIAIGSGTFVSSTVIIIRKRAFEAKIQELFDSRWSRQQPSHLAAQLSHPDVRDSSMDALSTEPMPQRNVAEADSSRRLTACIKHGTQALSSCVRVLRKDHMTVRRKADEGRSRPPRLTAREKRRLGGIEYEALCLLAWLVPLYICLFQLLGAIGCGLWVRVNRPGTTESNGLNPFWTGVFFAISAFNNCGMALLDLNMTVFQDSYYLLLTMSFLILAGNTCFPPFLRLILWIMKQCLSATTRTHWQRWYTVIEFTLDHPRRIYTHLFPSRATWWLVFSLILLNGADWFAFEVFNLTNPYIISIPARFRAIDGLFQAFAVRAGGFYVVNIAALYPATQVMYVLMMYLSAFPVTMTMRSTNYYANESFDMMSDLRQSARLQASEAHSHNDARSHIETSIDPTEKHVRQIAAGAPTPFHEESIRSIEAGTQNAHRSGTDFFRHQLRLQLGHDLWLLALACLLITLIETSSFARDPESFSIFNILFEIVSGYGTVGISVGVPWANYSFSGAWHTGSKLILCVVMLRGRHRGLPVTIDRAVLLPDESLAWAEEDVVEDEKHR